MLVSNSVANNFANIVKNSNKGFYSEGYSYYLGVKEGIIYIEKDLREDVYRVYLQQKGKTTDDKDYVLTEGEKITKVLSRVLKRKIRVA